MSAKHLFALTLILSTLPSFAALREFKDKQGKVLKAELIQYDSFSTKVVLKNATNQKAKVSVGIFCEEDQAYINQWIGDQQFLSNMGFEFDVEKRRVGSEKKISRTSDGNGKITTKLDEYNYEVCLKNKSTAPIRDLHIEYMICCIQSGTKNDELIKETGSISCDPINPRSNVVLATDSVTMRTVKLPPNYYWADSKSSANLNSRIAGVWIKVIKKSVEGKDLVREYVSSEAIKEKYSWETAKK